jgi:hypothetical protein
MPLYAWIVLGVVVLIGLSHLAFLIEAISVTYQMLKGRRPDIRKGALWGTGSILSEATIQTINYQSALDHEHTLNEINSGHHDGISHDG